jgi:hypothetical protein
MALVLVIELLLMADRISEDFKLGKIIGCCQIFFTVGTIDSVDIAAI